MHDLGYNLQSLLVDPEIVCHHTNSQGSQLFMINFYTKLCTEKSMKTILISGLRDIVTEMGEAMKNIDIKQEEYQKLVVQHEWFDEISNTPEIKEMSTPPKAMDRGEL